MEWIELKLLACCDQGCSTGFATVSSNVLSRLVRDYDYEVHVNAINYQGDPHPSSEYMHLYPAHLRGDYLGVNRINELVQAIRPDVVFLFNDLQVIDLWLKQSSLENLPVVVYTPIDSYGLPPRLLHPLHKDNITVVTYTNFAKSEIHQSYPELTNVHVIGHGVDTELFHALSDSERLALREKYGVPANMFIFLNVNRNQIRKNIPATMRAFASIKNRLPDARLYLHMVWDESPPKGSGWNLEDLREMYKLTDRLMTTTIEVNGKRKPMTDPLHGIDATILAQLYQISDVFVNTATGEGWSLSSHEALACGLPVIATDCSALSEIVRGRGLLAKVESWMTMQFGTRFAIVDEHDVAKKMMRLATDDKLRKECATAGAEWAVQQTWDGIVKQWHEIFSMADRKMLAKASAPSALATN